MDSQQESSQMDTPDATGPTDAALAAAWAAGDERAYEQIVGRYAPLVYQRCRRALGAADADDATQAVFLVLARRRGPAAASPVLAAWLLTVADNVLRNALRDRLRRTRAERALPPPPPATDGHAMDDIQESFREHLDASLAELPAAERDAVALHHLAGRSLAEVARETGAGLSTIKDRLARGLDRLRRALAARGVTLGAAALVTGLAAEAQAAVPEALMLHLRDPTLAGGGPGATPGPSPRAVRWSQTSTIPMSRIALAGSALLLAGAAAGLAIQAADQAPPASAPAATAPAVIAPARRPAPADPRAIDPEHARSWVIARWNDGARTVQRLSALPEAALLPAEGRAILDQIAGVREAVVVIDGNVVGRREQQIEQFRLQEALRTLPDEAAAKEIERHARALMANADKASTDQEAPGSRGQDSFDVGGIHGWIAVHERGRPMLASLRTWLLGISSAAFSSTGPGGRRVDSAHRAWLGAATAVDVAAPGLHHDNDRLTMNLPADAAVAAMLTRAARLAEDGADVELASLVDPGWQGADVRTDSVLRMTVTADGLRMRMSMPPTAKQAAPASTLDPKRLDAVPADALVAAGMAMRAGDLDRSPAWRGIFLGLLLPMEASAAKDPAKATSVSLIRAVAAILNRIDGAAIAWIQPGTPFPTCTIEADLPQAAFADLATALTTAGIATATDATTVSIAAGMMLLELGWRDGRAILTSVPGGIAAIDRRGGFTAQPDIVRALAAMPDRQPSACALLRPAACTAYAAPFVGMMAPEWQGRLAEYQRRLGDQQAYAFAALTTDAGGTSLEASGMLSVIAAAVLASQAGSVLGMSGVN